jgi:hypothetical protein
MTSVIIDKVKNISSSLYFNSADKQHLIIMSLNSTIFEMASSCIVLMQSQMYSSIPIILRSMIEALSLLVSISSDKDKARLAAIDCYIQRSKTAKLLKKFKMSSDSLEQLQKIETKADTIISMNSEINTQRGIVSRIQENLAPGFELSYRMFCSEAHHDIDAVGNRHLVECEDGGYSVELFKNKSLQDVVSYLDIIIVSMIIATEVISSVVISFKKEKITSLKHKYNQFKKRFML